MMRRSKIKVRPAIKRPSQGGAPSQPSTPKSSPPVQVKKSPIGSGTDLPVNTPPPVNAVVNVAAPSTADHAGKLSEANKKVLDASTLPCDNVGTPNNKNAVKPQMARRRKLVACPTMARKRSKTSNTDPKTAAQIPSNAVMQEKVVPVVTSHITSLISTGPEVEKVTLPMPLEPIETEVGSGGVDRKCSTEFTTLSTVRNISLAEEEVAEKESNDQTFGVDVMTVVAANATVSSASQAYKTHTSERLSRTSAKIEDSEPQASRREEQAKIDDTSSLDKIRNENSNSGLQQNTLMKKITSKPKTVSATLMHRNNAMAKLKKLKEDQKDNEKWPELDQNVVSMSDLIFLNPPDKIGLKLGMNVRREDAERTVAEREKTPEPEPSTSTQEEVEDAALPVPQIRIAEDGSVVIDEESLIVDTKKPPSRKAHKTIYEVGREGMVNQCSFLRRPHARPARWSNQETDKFYQCLCIVGAEFTLMGAMFRGRSADDLRRKFKRERKLNPNRVDNALMQQHLSKWTDDMFEPKGTYDDSNKSINVSMPAEETVK